MWYQSYPPPTQQAPPPVLFPNSCSTYSNNPQPPVEQSVYPNCSTYQWPYSSALPSITSNVPYYPVLPSAPVHNSEITSEKLVPQPTSSSSKGNNDIHAASQTIDDEYERFISRCKALDNLTIGTKRSRKGTKSKSHSRSKYKHSPNSNSADSGSDSDSLNYSKSSKSHRTSKEGSDVQKISGQSSHLSTRDNLKHVPKKFSKSANSRSRSRSVHKRSASPYTSTVSASGSQKMVKSFQLRKTSEEQTHTKIVGKTHSRSSVRSSITKEEALDCLRQLHDREFEEYRRKPETHPHYVIEKKRFDDHMKKKGFDLTHQAVEREWKKYFNLILEQKFGDTWSEKEEKFLKKFDSSLGRDESRDGPQLLSSSATSNNSKSFDTSHESVNLGDSTNQKKHSERTRRKSSSSLSRREVQLVKDNVSSEATSKYSSIEKNSLRSDRGRKRSLDNEMSRENSRKLSKENTSSSDRTRRSSKGKITSDRAKRTEEIRSSDTSTNASSFVDHHSHKENSEASRKRYQSQHIKDEEQGGRRVNDSSKQKTSKRESAKYLSDEKKNLKSKTSGDKNDSVAHKHSSTSRKLVEKNHNSPRKSETSAVKKHEASKNTPLSNKKSARISSSMEQNVSTSVKGSSNLETGHSVRSRLSYKTNCDTKTGKSSIKNRLYIPWKDEERLVSKQAISATLNTATRISPTNKISNSTKSLAVSEKGTLVIESTNCAPSQRDCTKVSLKRKTLAKMDNQDKQLSIANSAMVETAIGPEFSFADYQLDEKGKTLENKLFDKFSNEHKKVKSENDMPSTSQVLNETSSRPDQYVNKPTNEFDTELKTVLASYSPYMNLFFVLTQMKDKFGAFSEPLSLLQDMLLQKQNEGKCLLDCIDSDAETLLILVKDKLNDFVSNKDISVVQQAIYLETLTNLDSLLDDLKEQRDKDTTKDILDQIDIKNLATAVGGKGCKETVNFIKEIMMYQQIKFDNKDIMTVYMAVKKYQAALEIKKNIDNSNCNDVELKTKSASQVQRVHSTEETRKRSLKDEKSSSSSPLKLEDVHLPEKDPRKVSSSEKRSLSDIKLLDVNRASVSSVKSVEQECLATKNIKSESSKVDQPTLSASDKTFSMKIKASKPVDNVNVFSDYSSHDISDDVSVVPNCKIKNFGQLISLPIVQKMKMYSNFHRYDSITQSVLRKYVVNLKITNPGLFRILDKLLKKSR